MPRLVLDGIFVPHVTPFRLGGQLDINALRECVRFWLQSGVSGLVPCGSNGEAPYLSRQERKKVVETVLDEANGKVPVVAGTGSMSTQETIALTKDAADLGVDAALIVTPFYFRLTNREIHEHYRTVCQAVDLPIVVYNVPKFTGFSLEPASIQKLSSENQSIMGVKESSGSLGTISEVIRLLGNRLSVLAGTADVALPTLLAGGRGAVIAVANVFPTLCSRMYAAFKNGQYEEASRLQNRITFANEVLVRRVNQLSAIKEAMRLNGMPGGYPRRPALPLNGEEKKTVEALLKEIDDPSNARGHQNR
ncbi:MAG: 4-hydroxy-tetrahydrodipicolinate synthase [Candidatus Bathyarchaeia archaeon]